MEVQDKEKNVLKVPQVRVKRLPTSGRERLESTASQANVSSIGSGVGIFSNQTEKDIEGAYEYIKFLKKETEREYAIIVKPEKEVKFCIDYAENTQKNIAATVKESLKNMKNYLLTRLEARNENLAKELEKFSDLMEKEEANRKKRKKIREAYQRDAARIAVENVKKQVKRDRSPDKESPEKNRNKSKTDKMQSGISRSDTEGEKKNKKEKEKETKKPRKKTQKQFIKVAEEKEAIILAAVTTKSGDVLITLGERTNKAAYAEALRKAVTGLDTVKNEESRVTLEIFDLDMLTTEEEVK